MANDNSIAFITAVNDDEMYKKCKEYISRLKVPTCIEKIEIIPIYGAKSMCSAYNKGMKKSSAKYKIYLHQDLMITDEDFLFYMMKSFKEDPKLAILGVAGCVKMPESGIWWESAQLAGQFYDTHNDEKIPSRNRFNINSTDVIEVEALDGCILCTQYDYEWDEDLFNGWHFYDISQCFKVRRDKISKVGIIPSALPLVTHLCGRANLGDYPVYQRRFIRKYMNSKIEVLILCPGGATGGIELLHQLVKAINESDPRMDAKLMYTDLQSRGNDPEYKDYNTPYVYHNYKLNDTQTVIFPEIYAHLTNLKRWCGVQKVIYWESVDNYFKTCPKDLLGKFPDNTFHIVQSQYAYEFLINKYRIPDKNIMFVTDYLNGIFLSTKKRRFKRLPQVIYNPKKDTFVKKLIEYMHDIKFVPIENMNREEVIRLMYKSMLYVDFGTHPGKDRMPREAAMCGCCILTSLNGAARNPVDIKIKDVYKINCNNESNFELICDMIRIILNNYESYSMDFNSYRTSISDEPEEFKYQVQQFTKMLYKI